MTHPRIWLLACMGWCMVWTLPVQASWEEYQQAGEAAYDRGDYATAERMFLAAVREARYFGAEDPRLDISLNKLALLRVTRSAYSRAEVPARRVTRSTAHTRRPSVSRHGKRRQVVRPGLRQARPGRHRQAMQSARPGARRTGTRTTVERAAHRTQRPHATRHRASPTRRVAQPVRHERRREALRQPRLQRETPRPQRRHTLQQPQTTRRHTETTPAKHSPPRSRQR